MDSTKKEFKGKAENVKQDQSAAPSAQEQYEAPKQNPAERVFLEGAWDPR